MYHRTSGSSSHQGFSLRMRKDIIVSEAAIDTSDTYCDMAPCIEASRCTAQGSTHVAINRSCLTKEAYAR